MKNGNHASFRLAVATSAILVFSLFFLASLRNAFADPNDNIAAWWKFDVKTDIEGNQTEEGVSALLDDLCQRNKLGGRIGSGGVTATCGSSLLPDHGPMWSDEESPRTTVGSLLFEGEDGGDTSEACDDDGECGFVLTDLEMQTDPVSYTVAFWVKTTHIQPAKFSWFPMPVMSYHGEAFSNKDNGFSVGVGFYDVNPEDENDGDSGIPGGITFMYERDHDELCGVASTDGNRIVNDGDWHHVAATWEAATGDKVGKNFQIYIDGTRVMTAAFERHPGGGSDYCNNSVGDISGDPATIGYNAIWSHEASRTDLDQPPSDNYEEFFDGQLDDVRVYTRALSLDEIWELSGGEPALNISDYPPESGLAPLIGNANSDIQFQGDYQGAPGSTVTVWEWDYNGTESSNIQSGKDEQVATYRWDALGEKTVELSVTVDVSGTKKYSDTAHKIQISTVTISDDGIDGVGNPNVPVTFTAQVDNALVLQDPNDQDGDPDFVLDYEWAVTSLSGDPLPTPPSPQLQEGLTTKEDEQVFTWDASGDDYTVLVTVTAKKDGFARGILTSTHTIDIGSQYPSSVEVLNEGGNVIESETVAFDEANGYRAIVRPSTVNWPVEYSWDCTFCTGPAGEVDVTPAALPVNQSHPYTDTRIEGTDTLTSAWIDFEWNDTRADPKVSPFVSRLITSTAENPIGAVKTSVLITVSHRPTIAPGGTTLADVGPFTATILEDSQSRVTYRFDIEDKDTADSEFLDNDKIGVAATPDLTSLHPDTITYTLSLTGDLQGKQRQLSYSLRANQWGTVSTTVRACDVVGLCGNDTAYLNILPVNDVPTFVLSQTELTVQQDTPEQSLATWARDISRGTYEDHQDMVFHVTPVKNSGNVDIDDMFTVSPTITPTGSASGTLRFEPAPGAFGSVVYDVSLQDNGGTANGGQDTSETQRFTLTIESGTPLTPVTTREDTPLDIRYARMVNYTTQSSDPVLQGTASNEGGTLQATDAPTDSAELGYVTYTPPPHFFGEANSADLFSYEYYDGVMTRTAELSITVTPVNDPPSFAFASTILTSTSAPVEKVVENWVNDISPGPSGLAAPYNENNQSFLEGYPQVTTTNPDLFTVQPALMLEGSSADLTFTPAVDVTGDVTVTVTFQDDGGTADGGTDIMSDSFVLRFKQDDPPVVATTVLSTPMNTPLEIAARYRPGAEVVGLMTDVDEDDVLSFAAINRQPEHGSLEWSEGDAVIRYTPDDSFVGTDSFRYTITDGYLQTEGEVTINVIGGHKAYLPLVMRTIFRADLSLAENGLQIVPDRSAEGNVYAAGEPVVVNVTVTNNGNKPTDPFWVDLFINPAQEPDINTNWFDVCTLDPCFGLVWGLEQPLDVGQSVTFTSAYTGSETQPLGYREAYSAWEGWFANGTTDLYVLVDSWNQQADDGGIPELNEDNNLSHLSISVTGTNPAAAGSSQAAPNQPPEPQPSSPAAVSRASDLPARPAAPGGQ